MNPVVGLDVSKGKSEVQDVSVTTIAVTPPVRQTLCRFFN
jgi:hypothetical protein